MKEQDVLRRFLFEELGIRGEWVKLTQSWQQAKSHQQGDEAIQQQLGQALVAVVMLSATIKFKGSMILQTQGDGHIQTLVAQSTEDKKIRGLVRARENAPPNAQDNLFGQGQLVLTVTSDNNQPYQGIVPLQTSNLAASLEMYFSQSEQLKTRLWLFANETDAAGLFIQELPEQDRASVYDHDAWDRIEILANTITSQEILDLDAEDLLHRLFHEEQVRLFDPEPVEFYCRCSRQLIEKTLRAMGRAELEDILQEQGAIEVDCEFCGKHYSFDQVDVEAILVPDGVSPPSNTRH
ncbi:MAG: Hsp33 family molecular chaperone HslO [Methylococcales bacterium]|nr:Hsp33 family molecular chaperone HslO [Methylococcales bacterium]